jgi:hypothetical protein
MIVLNSITIFFQGINAIFLVEPSICTIDIQLFPQLLSGKTVIVDIPDQHFHLKLNDQVPASNNRKLD